ncbi:MAG: hypothetical protein HXS50_05640, partial [Theionarchaea archaeon]|nr:hypothetical protein [Theionarchaea archaeon]
MGKMKDQNSPELFARDVDSLRIVLGARASNPEMKAARMLEGRIKARSGARASTITENDGNPAGEKGIVVLVGVPGNHDMLQDLVPALRMKLPSLPDIEKIHSEGFALRTATVDGIRYVVVAGSDGRGTIYGVGELLRSIIYNIDGIDLPHLDFIDKPALPLRGTVALSVGPNYDATKFAELRPQTEEERAWGVEDMILVGANTFKTMEEMAREYGLMTGRSTIA